MVELETSFRRESSRLTAWLVRQFGPEKLELAEDVVQETFVRAAREWSMRGLPVNSSAWLRRVARNLAVDVLRRERIYAPQDLEAVAAPDDESMMDCELRMLFLCAHPSLTSESAIALTLRTLCGLDVHEIARGLLSTPTAVEQRLTRARRNLREIQAAFDLPLPVELTSRLRLVLKTLYLTFNEGYTAYQGPDLTNSDLCHEALLLTERLLATPEGKRPETHALYALMCLHASRLPARVGRSGALLRLPDQDRTQWSQPLIGLGLEHLSLAATGDELTCYHCEAAIAALHCTARSYAETDWAAVLQHYDDLLTLAPSDIARLNRAVAIAELHGPRAGIEVLEIISSLQSYHLYHATLADFRLRAGDLAAAKRDYARALDLARNEAERRFLKKRLSTAAAG